MKLTKEAYDEMNQLAYDLEDEGFDIDNAAYSIGNTVDEILKKGLAGPYEKELQKVKDAANNLQGLIDDLVYDYRVETDTAEVIDHDKG